MAAKKMGRCSLEIYGRSCRFNFLWKLGVGGGVRLAGRSRHACELLQAAVDGVSASDHIDPPFGTIGPCRVKLHSSTITGDSHRLCTASCGH